MKAILLCAGKGVRLGDLTRTCPKCLLPVGGRPLLSRWLDCLAAAGVSDVLINTHHLRGQVEAFAERYSGPLRLSLVHENVLLGSAGTLADNADFVAGEPFFAVYGDNYTDMDLLRLRQHHEANRRPMTVSLFRAPNPRACGIVGLNEEGVVVSFQEKPSVPASNLACAGIFLCEPQVLEAVPSFRPADMGTDLMPLMVGMASGFLWDGTLVDIGTPEGYATALRLSAGLGRS